MAHKIVVLDFETTGVSSTDMPVEVAWVELDDALTIVNQGHSLLNPGMPIPAEASAVHGIFDADVANAPLPAEYFSTNGFTTDVILIAHNAAFDAKFLASYCTSITQLCTLRLVKNLVPNLPSNKLGDLVEQFSLPASATHRADADVEACYQLLLYLAEKFNLTLPGLLETSKTNLDTYTMPFGKHKGMLVKDMPKSYVRWLQSQNEPPTGDLAAAFEKFFP